MKALVLGGSWSTPQGTVFRILDTVADEIGITRLVVPMLWGIDRHVTRWGNMKRIPVTQVPTPQPRTKGRTKNAVEVREDRMIQHAPDVMIAFGNGPMVRRMKRRADGLFLPYCWYDERNDGLSWSGHALELLQRIDLGDPQ